MTGALRRLLNRYGQETVIAAANGAVWRGRAFVQPVLGQIHGRTLKKEPGEKLAAFALPHSSGCGYICQSNLFHIIILNELCHVFGNGQIAIFMYIFSCRIFIGRNIFTKQFPDLSKGGQDL